MASASSGPAWRDVDRVDLHRLPSRGDVLRGGTSGLTGNSPPLTISSWAACVVRYSMQPARLRLLVGRLHDAGAGHVGVGARAVLVGPRRRDGEVGVLVERARQVVVVGEADVAVTGRHHGEQLTVGVEDLGVVGHPRLQQGLGRLGAALGEHVGDERLVVLVARRAQAGAALALRIAQVLVARDLARRRRARSTPPAPAAARSAATTRPRGRAAPRGRWPRARGWSSGASSPASSARHRLARSVVTSTSAGVSEPSRSSRSNSSGPVPPRSLTSMPVAFVKSWKTVSSP